MGKICSEMLSKGYSIYLCRGRESLKDLHWTGVSWKLGDASREFRSLRQAKVYCKRNRGVLFADVVVPLVGQLKYYEIDGQISF